MGCATSSQAGGSGGSDAVKEHDISGRELTALPSKIPKNVEKLDCSQNQLALLPDTIVELAMLKELDANDNALTALPEVLVGCVALEKLLVYKNKIKALPPAFPPSLTELNFFNNLVRKLPDSIGELKCLEEVNFSANKLMMTNDKMFAGWASVKVLNMYDNNLVRFGSLAPLVALEELRLHSNNLEELPTLPASAPELKIIEAHKNRIAAIKDDYFAGTPALERISLWSNALTALPSSLVASPALVGMQVQENQLASVPGGLAWSPKLETVFLQSNSITTLPSELKACASLKRVNLSKLQLDGAGSEVAEAVKALCLAQSGGIFWGTDGAQQAA